MTGATMISASEKSIKLGLERRLWYLFFERFKASARSKTSSTHYNRWYRAGANRKAPGFRLGSEPNVFKYARPGHNLVA
jgi:hypothetical protein